MYHVIIKYCRIARVYIILFILLGAFVSCKNSKQKEIVALLKKWEYREILFPENITFSMHGQDTVVDLSKFEFKIVSYMDSIGCTSCKLRLREWDEFVTYLNFSSQNGVSAFFFLYPKNIQEIELLLKRDNFNYPVFIDTEDLFNKLNHFPTELQFQTFLLNKDNKVMVVGNPIHNPKIKELYLNIIQGNTYTKEKELIKTEVEVKEPSISLGHFSWQKEQKVDFTIYNIGKQPLVINDITTSCGCTSVDYSKEPVRPGDSISLQVTYKADKPEHFNKTITVYCNADPSLVHLKIIGDAE